MSRQEAEEINQEGVRHLQDGDVEQSLQKFSAAIEKDETFPFPYCHIGNVLAAAGQYEDALPWFEKAVELDHEMATAYYGLGNAYYSLEQFERAFTAFQEAESKGLNDGDVYFMLGMSLMQQQDEDYTVRALAYFQQAVDHNPDDMEAVFQRGLSAAYLGHLDQAKQDFKTVIRNEKEHADAHFNLGVAYAYEDKKHEALEQLDRAIEIQPNHALALRAKQQIKEQ